MRTLFVFLMIAAGSFAQTGASQVSWKSAATGGVFTNVGAVLDKNAVTPQMFGAKGDAVLLTTGAMTAGSAVLTASGANFTSADVGKKIDVNGAGTPNAGQQYVSIPGVLLNANLAGTIVSRQSATQVTLSVAAGTTVSGKQVVYGTDDHAALVSWLSATGASYCPPGQYVNGSNIKLVLVNKTVSGAGIGACTIWSIGPITYAGAGPNTYESLTVDNGSHDVRFTGIQWRGTNVNGELNTFNAQTSDGILLCTGIPGGLSGVCNSSSGISNIYVDNCAFDNLWGMGFHAPGTGTGSQQVKGIYLMTVRATYSSYDGLNPNPYTDLTVSNSFLDHNGTGGIESATLGRAVIRGNIATYNRLVGITLSGGDATHLSNGSVIANNVVSDTGVGIIYQAQGISIDTFMNMIVTGNVILRSNSIGLQIGNTTNTKNALVTGNYIADNGLIGQTGIGIYALGNNSTISDNVIRNTGTSTGYDQSQGIQMAFSDSNHVHDNDVTGHTGLADYVFNACTKLSFSNSDLSSTYNSISSCTFAGWGPTDTVPALTVSSNTIAPTRQYHTVGAGLIKTITVPFGLSTTAGWFTVVPTAAFTTDATGNVAIATTATVGRAMTFTLANNKWYPSY